MASKPAAELAVKVVTSAASMTGTTMNSPQGGMVEFLAAQIDVAAELVSHGPNIRPAHLGLVLAQKGLSVSDLIPDDTFQCLGSLATMGTSLAAVAVSVPTGLGVYVTALGLLADLYATYGDCRGPVARAQAQAMQNAVTFWARFEYEFWAWVQSQGGANLYGY